MPTPIWCRPCGNATALDCNACCSCADDFYFAVNRFYQRLEVPILEGQNYALVDRFDLDHARKVLAAFGRAYGKLAERSSAMTEDQQAFLSQAIAELAQDGKVICVHLALFAEMMKGRTWTPASLRQVGGMQGLGLTFLDETFTAKSASPTHRVHERAARSVLQSLLPEVGTDLKVQMQPVEKLLQASGYADRPDDFRRLLAILESEVRLIAPAGLDDNAPLDGSAGSGPALLPAHARFSGAGAARLADAQTSRNPPRAG